jgi:hypothetical protein
MPPIIDARTCTGSGPWWGAAPAGRLRGAPLGPRAVEEKLVVDAPGDISESDDARGTSPGREGRGPGPDGG